MPISAFHEIESFVQTGASAPVAIFLLPEIEIAAQPERPGCDSGSMMPTTGR